MKYKRFASKMREDLLRKLKVVSAVEEKQIQELLEEAVIKYLENRQVKEESDDELFTVSYSMVRRDPTKQDEE